MEKKSANRCSHDFPLLHLIALQPATFQPSILSYSLDYMAWSTTTTSDMAEHLRKLSYNHILDDYRFLRRSSRRFAGVEFWSWHVIYRRVAGYILQQTYSMTPDRKTDDSWVFLRPLRRLYGHKMWYPRTNSLQDHLPGTMAIWYLFQSDLGRMADAMFPGRSLMQTGEV